MDVYAEAHERNASVALEAGVEHARQHNKLDARAGYWRTRMIAAGSDGRRRRRRHHRALGRASARPPGVDVVVYDRAGIGAGASGVQPGGVRQQWGTRVNCVLARESFQFYRDVAERLDAPHLSPPTPCGYVFLAHSRSALQALAAEVALQREAGVPSELRGAGRAQPSSSRRSRHDGLPGGLLRRGRLLRPPAGGRRGVRAGGAAARAREIELCDVAAIAPDGAGLRVERRDGERHERTRRPRRRRRHTALSSCRSASTLPIEQRGRAPLLQRADPGAAARAARDLGGAPLRGQAARRRPRARERPLGRRRPGPAGPASGGTSIRRNVRDAAPAPRVRRLTGSRQGLLRRHARRPADRRRGRRTTASGSPPASAATASCSPRRSARCVADSLLDGAVRPRARARSRSPASRAAHLTPELQIV